MRGRVPSGPFSVCPTCQQIGRHAVSCIKEGRVASCYGCANGACTVHDKHPLAGRVPTAKVVYKYRLDFAVQTLDLPVGTKILTVASQDGHPCVWTEVDPSAPSERRTLSCFGTGHPIPPGEVYVGTAHDVGGAGLVFHVYERTNDA